MLLTSNLEKSELVVSNCLGVRASETKSPQWEMAGNPARIFGGGEGWQEEMLALIFWVTDTSSKAIDVLQLDSHLDTFNCIDLSKLRGQFQKTCGLFEVGMVPESHHRGFSLLSKADPQSSGSLADFSSVGFSVSEIATDIESNVFLPSLMSAGTRCG